MPHVLDRIKKVVEYRSKSTKKSTKRKAETPTLFDEERIPEKRFLLVPRVSSVRRKYIPIGYIDPEIIVSDATLMLPNSELFHFGVIISSIHMIWMKTIAGRLKSDYRYSKDIVYNNFPWPDPTEDQKHLIEKTAQMILDARALYPDSSLADLYDPLSMPPELVKAHKLNDKAVKTAYGGKGFETEAERVADLMDRYVALISGD